MAEEKGNPDALQDEKLIEDWAMRNLAPILRQFKCEIDDLKGTSGNHHELIHGIVGGFSNAAKSHRRNNLASSLDLGDDYEGINGIYKDLEGSDLKEDFIDHIMENDISDEEIEEMKQILMGNARSKYGKYKRSDDPLSEEPKGGVEIEIASPDGKEGSEEEPKETEGKEKSPVDAMYEKVMSQHKSKRGIKL